MKIIERGSGNPIVLVPGIQGRWEYLIPAIDALASSLRVLTFSLCDEPSADGLYEPSRGMDNYAEQIARAMDQQGLERACICGVSFGGLGALRFAARWPERTTALVLASVPGPDWHLKPRHALYARFPLVFGPLFAIESPFRLRKEIVAAVPGMQARWRFTIAQLRTLVRAPISFARLAQRASLISQYDRPTDCTKVSSPTLVLHGSPALDHVVDAAGTSEYGSRISDARVVTLEDTGHLGSITRPRAFADAILNFMETVRKGSRVSAA